MDKDIPKRKKKPLASTREPKVTYLPSVYDPKKVREGILELLSWVEVQESNDKDKNPLKTQQRFLSESDKKLMKNSQEFRSESDRKRSGDDSK